MPLLFHIKVLFSGFALWFNSELYFFPPLCIYIGSERITHLSSAWLHSYMHHFCIHYFSWVNQVKVLPPACSPSDLFVDCFFFHSVYIATNKQKVMVKLKYCTTKMPRLQTNNFSFKYSVKYPNIITYHVTGQISLKDMKRKLSSYACSLQQIHSETYFNWGPVCSNCYIHSQVCSVIL